MYAKLYQVTVCLVFQDAVPSVWPHIKFDHDKWLAAIVNVVDGDLVLVADVAEIVPSVPISCSLVVPGKLQKHESFIFLIF